MADTRADAGEASASFRATASADRLRACVSALGALVDECRVELAPEGLRVRAMDPATVAAVDLRLDRAAFDRYEATGTTVGLALDRLEEALATAEGSVELALRPETHTLRVASGDFEYALGLVDPSAIRSPPDAIAPDEGADLAAVTLSGDTFGRAVDAAAGLADHLTLAVDPDGERFRVEAGGDTDEFTLDRAGADLPGFEAREADSVLSVDYLRAVARELPDGPVDLRLGVEHPLYVTFDLADGDGRVRYAVAPRLRRT
ncbi:DNA polymerase sliding clamp [Halosegnis marinus]|uniref:DNA polymerase sliding clamp n=1 Tax=Halosegnis marinus TaxID=3034023 RepID=A0ABD5ZLV1_9EURY|nr:DNA polymerase sliding clamp [Halosegnis sp. DT85]